LSADVLLCNDVDALLLANNRPDGCAVAVSGTGSGFAASDGERVPVRIGGLEYLAGDEGGAFDLGLSGLRAAARAVDGRGTPTVLAEMLARESGRPFAELARDLAALAFPKRPVAMLAPVVTAAWRAGDAVAADLVRAAVHELVAGVRAARDRAGLRDGWTAIAMGGVFTGCGELFTLFARAVSERLGAQEVRLLGYPAVDLIRALCTWGGTAADVPWAEQVAAALTIGRDREVGRV
jgi:N-acetylglucosamine kinase-like BadF-type ATPase